MDLLAPDPTPALALEARAEPQRTATVLMCTPRHYGVHYEINPWMRVTRPVEAAAARRQWRTLAATYRHLGVQVRVVEPVPRLPDMVFTANAALVHGARAVLSRFRHPERQAEEEHWLEVLEGFGLEVVVPPRDCHFEGAGDALFAGSLLFAGFGPRTARASHRFVARALQVETVSLELIDPRFYHLDTCFCPIDGDTALAVREAFSSTAWRLIEETVPNLIRVPLEAGLGFACNGLVVGRHFVSASAANALEPALTDLGYTTVGLAMDEFIKAGGAVRCLSLPLSQ